MAVHGDDKGQACQEMPGKGFFFLALSRLVFTSPDLTVLCFSLLGASSAANISFTFPVTLPLPHLPWVTITKTELRIPKRARSG